MLIAFSTYASLDYKNCDIRVMRNFDARVIKHNGVSSFIYKN